MRFSRCVSQLTFFRRCSLWRLRSTRDQPICFHLQLSAISHCPPQCSHHLCFSRLQCRGRSSLPLSPPRWLRPSHSFTWPCRWRLWCNFASSGAVVFFCSIFCCWFGRETSLPIS